jgi:four helix bundle protein
MPNSSGGGGSTTRPGSYKDLIVWQKAMDLAVEVYRIAAKFPGRETYGLAAQITRVAASVPANIAEGRGRASRKDFAHFLSVAKGSLMETETFVDLALRLGYTQPKDAEPILNLVTEVSKMLTKLRIRLLEAKDSSSS